MPAASTTPRKFLKRPERDRSPTRFSSMSGQQPEMEDTMYEALMKFGGYRVDYFNREKAGWPDALGLYVLGDLPAHQRYSRAAKHNLLAGLVMIREQHEAHNLVAVYLDINSPFESHRPAYEHMKRDIKAGLFRRLLVPEVADLVGGSDMHADFWKFYRELAWIEILSAAGGRFAPIRFPQPAGSPLVSAA